MTRPRSALALSLAALVPLATACAVQTSDTPSSSADEAVQPATSASWTPSAAVQRRLRLLSGLPKTMQGLLTTMSGTFLGKGPTMAFGLVLDDGLFYAQGFSSASLASSSASDPTADTVYRMGSQNKAITATGMMRLLETKTSVKATDLASKYVADASAVHWPAGETHTGAPPITLLDLVSHTSGLPNYGGAAYAPTVNALSPSESDVLAMLHDVTLEFDPGTRRDYSGVGMTLAGIAIEKITGTPYRSWIASQVLAPLGMTSTAFDPTTLPSIAPRWSNAGSSYAPDTSPYLDIGALAPAGQLFTTVRDMAKLMTMEISGAAPSSTPDTFLLKRADLLKTQKDQFPAATTAGSEPCGYGWWLNGGGEGYIHHNGGLDHFASNLFFSPSSRIGLTVLISTEDSTNTDVILPPVLDLEVRADAQNDWQDFPLSMGVERILHAINTTYSSSTASNFSGLTLPAGETLKTLVTSWQSTAGTCSTFAVDRIYSATVADLTFTCSKQNVSVSVTTSATAPYPVTSVSVH